MCKTYWNGGLGSGGPKPRGPRDLEHSWYSCCFCSSLDCRDVCSGCGKWSFSRVVVFIVTAWVWFWSRFGDSAWDFLHLCWWLIKFTIGGYHHQVIYHKGTNSRILRQSRSGFGFYRIVMSYRWENEGAKIYAFWGSYAIHTWWFAAMLHGQLHVLR